MVGAAGEPANGFVSPVLLPKQVQSPTRLLRPSLADLVGKEGLSYADARKQIARYAQERHAERARAAEAALRQQQDAMYARDVAARAATWGNPTTANAIERLHARDREDAARAALIANSTKRKAGKREAQLAAERARRDVRADAAQLLHGMRRLLTAGVLDLPQQGLAALPPDVSTTLALQLGGLRRVNLPRNELKQLLTIDNAALSCAHFRSVTEMNLSGNGLTALPAQMGRCVALQTLRLEQNRLSSLPDSLLRLPCLRRLNLRENSFAELPYAFGELKCLEWLDVSSNMLSALPPTLPLMLALAHLDLDNNGMPHLAIPPALRTTDAGTDAAAAAARRGQDANCEPAEHCVAGLQEGSSAYNKHRTELADRGIFEWSSVPDPETGRVTYLNNVNGDRSDALPACMDRLGSLASLTCLKANRNRLRSLPASVCHCAQLTRLEASRNFLEALPAEMGLLQKLETLLLDKNCLSQLPGSFAKCQRLKELSVASNYFVELPEFCMHLRSLEQLRIGSNQLQRLPYALGLVTTLRELHLHDNPLVDPPASLLLQGTDALLFECRKRYYAQQKGPPPAVGVHQYGIQGEKLALVPEFNAKLQAALDRAAKCGEFHFTMEGLKVLPAGLLKPAVAAALTSLRLDTNAIGPGPLEWSKEVPPDPLAPQQKRQRGQPPPGPVTVTFAHLRVLSLKGCSLRDVGDGVRTLTALRELLLERNRLTALPPALLALKQLEVLDLRENCIMDLPADVGALARLRQLELSGNRLELLPESICSLRQLHTLTLANNVLAALPTSITALSSLKVLDVDGNRLARLPPGFGALRLEALRAAYNRLEALSDDALTPNLHASLERLWLSSNNLLELPEAFSLLEGLGSDDLRLELNPLLNPPVEIVAEGTAAVAQYCRMRCARLREMAALLLQAGFEADAARLAPEAEDVLTGGTGYLTADDLKQADAAIDRCVNKAFYRNPLSAADVADRITALRRDRGREFHEAILMGLRNRLEVHERTQAFPSSAFRRDLTRPWGRRGEGVPCFAITLDALLYEKPAAPPPLDGASASGDTDDSPARPSLWSETLPTLPPSMHPYTAAAMKKAVAKVRSAYGRAACFDANVAYEPCECVNWDTGQLLNHPPGTCYSRSLVIAKVCYTAEERARRRAEEKEMDAEFARVWTEVGTHIASKEGTRQIKAELRKRKALYTVRMGECTAEITTLKLQAKAKREVLTYQELRKTQLMQGMPVSFHNLRSLPEANDCIEAATAEAEAAGAALKAATKHYAELQRRVAGMSFAELVDEARAQLVRKYACMRCREVEDRHRRYAAKRGLRRPWDGTDGDANHFLEWGLCNDVTVPHRHELPANVQRYAQLPDTMESGENTDGVPLWQRYSWDDTESVELWQEPLYDAWLQHRRLRGSAAAALEDDSGCKSGGGSDDDDSGFDDVPPPPSAEEAATLHSSLHSHASTARTKTTATTDAPPPPLAAHTET